MIWGIGTDIVEIERMRRVIAKSNAFAKRILTDFEYNEYAVSPNQPAYLAKRFAAKEAVVKAVGTGIGNGIGWQHMQVEHNELGRPLLIPLDALAAWRDDNHIESFHISISDEKMYAVAYALIEKSK
ncbi:MAG: holo-ACP synthase [Pseudomonadota bacterium]